MYNVDKLEKQWYVYRRKKIILLLVSIFFIMAILVSGFYFFNTTKKVIDNKLIENTLVESRIVITQEPLVKKDINKSALNKLAIQVPSLDNSKIGQIIFQDSKEKVEKEQQKRKTLHIEVTERGDIDIAKDIESRFDFAKDKSDSLFLAKYYYDKNEYDKAEKWALETNKIDSSIEDSWLIFAKSQAKQGKRIESLKVLQAFYDQSRSVKVKILMDKIRRGKSF